MKKILLVLSIFVFVGFFCVGCKKTPDEVSQEAVAEYDQPATETITASEQTISPLMDQFLRQSAGSTFGVKAGTQISGIFEMWEAVLQHKSMEIHFEIEAACTLGDGEVQKDHVWENKTNRTVLDEYCQDNDLVWKITGPNTIRIEKK